MWGIVRRVPKRLVLVLICIGWYTRAAWSIYKLVQPPLAAAAAKGKGLKCIYEENEALDLHLHLSKSTSVAFDLPLKNETNTANEIPMAVPMGNGLHHVGSIRVPYSRHYTAALKDHTFQTENSFALISLNPVRNHHVNFTIPETFRHNSTLFILASVTRPTDGGRRHAAIPPAFYRLSQPLLFPQGRDSRAKRLLLDSFINQIFALLNRGRSVNSQPTTDVKRKTVHGVPSRFLLNLVVEHRSLDEEELLQRGMSSIIHNKRIVYPVALNIHVSPRDSYIPLVDIETGNEAGNGATSRGLKDDDERWRIRATYSPIGFATYYLHSIVQESLKVLETQYGFPAYDIDSLKMLVLGTSPWVTCLAMAISLFHWIFEILAVTSEIQFWRNRTSFVEFSAASLQLEIVTEFVISLYLYDCGESKIVFYFVLFRMLVAMWKLSKIPEGFSVTLFKSRKVKPLVETSSAGSESDEVRSAAGVEALKATSQPSEATSESLLPQVQQEDSRCGGGDGVGGAARISQDELNEFEALWMRRLFGVLLPIMAAVALYQLIWVPQHGWYSWMIRSLALCAYAGGFVGMTPQLFRNYKLKTVEHLPWHALSYQALNTFVDDIFSFIIRMPDMHRMSVFRDDIVFVIFHYQRWIYSRKPKHDRDTQEEDKKTK